MDGTELLFVHPSMFFVIGIVLEASAVPIEVNFVNRAFASSRIGFIETRSHRSKICFQMGPLAPIASHKLSFPFCDAQIEWEKRWKIFPQKFLTAFARYHATTLVLRLYEWTVAHWVTNQRMDMLTMDPFAASKTLAAKVDVKDHPMYAANRIAHTTFWANLLFTLSDYTVHQTLLCYAYYIYYQRKQQRRRTEGGSQPEGDDRAIVTSFVHRSGQLFASRGFALVCSAIGAGVGTIVRPGWGTLMMSSMGEGAATTIMDDGTVAAVAALNRSKDSSSSEL